MGVDGRRPSRETGRNLPGIPFAVYGPPSTVYSCPMPILHGFKQKVLDLGRGEAKTKARPLTEGDETLIGPRPDWTGATRNDRSCSGFSPTGPSSMSLVTTPRTTPTGSPTKP